MDCPACGADNREGAYFCRNCGAALVQPPLPPVEVPEALVEEPPPEAEAVETKAESQESLPGAEPAPAPPEQEMPAEEPSAEEEIESAGEPEVEVPTRPRRPLLKGSGVEILFELEGDEAGEEFDLLPEPEGDVTAFWREKAEVLIPAEPGTVVAGRYALVKVLDVQDDEVLYLAHDLQRCWQCGFEGNAPDEAFCAQCGASLDHKPEVRLLEVRNAGAEPSSGKPVDARLTYDGRFFLLLAKPEPEREAPSAPQSIRLLIGQRSDPGLVRELDEDSLLVLTLAPTYESRTGPVLGLFAVADGMGGHEAGEVASKAALQVLADHVLRTIALPQLAGEMVLAEDIVARLRQATMAANDAVYLARQKAGNDMGTTLTAALIRDDHLFLAHVGDCRAYRWNADGLTQLTTDHSVVASMIASGQAAPEEIYTHPHRSIIYRCIGDKPLVEVDTDVLSLFPYDRIIVCCDGLWEMVRDEGIEDVMMQEADPQLACDLLVEHANAAGGEDNISVIVVQVEAV